MPRYPRLFAILLLTLPRYAHATCPVPVGPDPVEALTCQLNEVTRLPKGPDREARVTTLKAKLSDACLARIQKTPLAKVKNLTRTLTCRNDSACALVYIMRQLAPELEIPAELWIAIAYRESRLEHWTDDANTTTKKSDTEDYGFMQINKRGWERYHQKDGWDWAQVVEDPVYNARMGGEILKWCFDYSRARVHKHANDHSIPFQRDDVFRCTYACYNGGPADTLRPFDPTSDYAHHDEKFLKDLRAFQKDGELLKRVQSDPAAMDWLRRTDSERFELYEALRNCI